jgi:hypothetical protein
MLVLALGIILHWRKMILSQLTDHKWRWCWVPNLFLVLTLL